MTQQIEEFNGFEEPKTNWFKMPNNWTDITAQITSLAEMKVVEYTIRHTWGYQEFGIFKRITIDEYMNGRKLKDGSRMDKGTGLSNRSVIDGLRRATEHGLLQEIINNSDLARIEKSYMPAMKHHCNDAHSDVKNVHTGVKNVHIWCEECSHRSEKETIERNSRKKRGGAGAPPAHSKEKSIFVKAYRSRFHLWPTAPQARIIDTRVEDIEKWQQVLEAWVGQGYSPRNLTGMLDWYNTTIPDYARKGGPKSNARTSKRRTPEQVQAAFEAEAERLRPFGIQRLSEEQRKLIEEVHLQQPRDVPLRA